MTGEALTIDQTLMDMFDQARKMVADADRRIAEEEERLRENERERLLLGLSARVEDAFDFTSKEKLAFEPRLDVQDGVGVAEFLVRTVRALFLLSPVEGNTWKLQVVQEAMCHRCSRSFKAGLRPNGHPAVCAAARIVAAVGNWVQNAKGSQRVQTAKPALRWRDDEESRPEPTFGTFLGHRL